MKKSFKPKLPEIFFPQKHKESKITMYLQAFFPKIEKTVRILKTVKDIVNVLKAIDFIKIFFKQKLLKIFISRKNER